MAEEEQVKVIQEALDDFLREIDRIKKDHAMKINAILDEINEEKIKKLKSELGI